MLADSKNSYVKAKKSDEMTNKNKQVIIVRDGA